MFGDPTEVALWRAAAESGIDKATLERDVRRVLDLPFDSERKRMTTLHSGRGGLIAYTKGAPESVFACCRAMATETGEIPFDGARAMGAAEAMAQDGLRVLAVACRRWDALPDERTPDAGRTRPHAAGAGRTARSPARGGEGRGGHLPDRGDHAGDDHRRPPGHGSRDRPPDRHPRERRHGADRAGAAGAVRCGTAGGGRRGPGVRPRRSGPEDPHRQGAAGRTARSSR